MTGAVLGFNHPYLHSLFIEHLQKLAPGRLNYFTVVFEKLEFQIKPVKATKMKTFGRAKMHARFFNPKNSFRSELLKLFFELKNP